MRTRFALCSAIAASIEVEKSARIRPPDRARDADLAARALNCGGDLDEIRGALRPEKSRPDEKELFEWRRSVSRNRSAHLPLLN